MLTLQSVRPARELPETGRVQTPSLETALDALRPIAAEAKLLVLAVAAHPDDEALGLSATLNSLAAAGGTVVLAVIAADSAERREESIQACERMGISHLLLFDGPDGDLAAHVPEVRSLLRTLDQALRPDIVLSHCVDDHPDHSVLASLSRQVFGRGGSTLLHFRIPQPTPGAFVPTAFVRVGKEAASAKLALGSCYPSQSWKDFFNPSRLLGSLVEAGICAGSDFAEAFELGSQVRLGRCQCGRPAPARNPARGEGDRRPAAVVGTDAVWIARLVLEPCPCGSGRVVIARRSLGAPRVGLPDSL